MLAAARVRGMCRNHCVSCGWRPGRVRLCVTIHGSEAIRPPPDVSKPLCALHLVARDVLDLKFDVDPNVPIPLRVFIHGISAEVWQRIDGNVLDTKC